MSKAYYVYSTLTADQIYNSWTHDGSEKNSALPTVEHSVLIKGGSNVVDRKTLVTPTGAVVTKITQKDLDALNENAVFKLHQTNGFIKVKEHAEDGEAAASDMDTRDQSAPLVPEDFKGSETGAPVLTGEEVKGASNRPNRKV